MGHGIVSRPAEISDAEVLEREAVAPYDVGARGGMHHQGSIHIVEQPGLCHDHLTTFGDWVNRLLIRSSV